MKKKLLCLLLIIYVSQGISQPPPCGCGACANEAQGDDYFVTTVGSGNITDTSAIITGSLRCSSCFQPPYQVSLQIGIAYDTVCSGIRLPSNSGNSAIPSSRWNRDTTLLYDSVLYQNVANLPSYMWPNTIPANQFSLRIGNLRPNTTYYARAYVIESPGPYIPATSYLGNGIQFTTEPAAPPTNNYILADTQNVCEATPAYVPSVKIKGSRPKGWIGNYSYSWEERIDSSSTWKRVTDMNSDSVDTKNITIKYAYSLVTRAYWYRRIVKSNKWADTTAPLRIVVFASNTIQNVSLSGIIQKPTKTKDLLLVPALNNYSGNFYVQWQDSIGTAKNKQGFSILNSNPDGSTLILQSSDSSNTYRVVVTCGKGCPTYTSAVIGISVSDGDGNIYPVITIGAQTWFMTNLRTTRTIDGNSIAYIKNESQWAATNDAAYCWHRNDPMNSIPFGALYNGYVLIQDSGKVCPRGWRIPTLSDWKTMAYYVGGTTASRAGQVLKSNTSWIQPNNATNTTNFNALPAGMVDEKGIFSGKYTSAYWAFLTDKTVWGYTQLINATSEIYYNTTSSQSINAGYSIRCVK